MKKNSIFSAIICLILTAAVVASTVGCTAEVQAADLNEGITANAVTGRQTDDRFVKAQADFAVGLFQKSYTSGKNSLISPLSVMLALSMTANGANGQTKEQMEAALGGISMDDLNEYLYTYVNALPDDSDYKLKLANSIWFRDEADRLTVEKDFLQCNADFYGADAYKAPFNRQTLDDINGWVKNNTDGMIDEILEEISNDAVISLINALVFDAKWQEPYEKNNIQDGKFDPKREDGQLRDVKMMHSSETYVYDKNAVGFIKDYKDGKYSFVAMLPDENITVDEYVASLTGEKLIALAGVRNYSETQSASVALPKFEAEYSVKMNSALAKMGMGDAFDAGKADFSRMCRSTRGNIYIDNVLHKTYISVDELGTKAGAVTVVEMRDSAAEISEKSVVLDRPFVYFIVDNQTGLPIFMGTVMDIMP